jgi:hypothetical protein
MAPASQRSLLVRLRPQVQALLPENLRELMILRAVGARCGPGVSSAKVVENDKPAAVSDVGCDHLLGVVCRRQTLPGLSA